MNINNYKLLTKKITNRFPKDLYISDVLLYESNDINDFKINNKNISVFRSARHKNDMPSVFSLSKISESLKDAVTSINESGSSLIKHDLCTIISDHLTIIGDSHNAFVIAFLGGEKHLIRVEIQIDHNANFKGLKIYAEINKLLKPNETLFIDKIEMYNTDNVNDAIDDFAKKKIKGIKVKDKQCPTAYCTWYYYGSTISLNDCLVNLKEIKRKKLPLDVFQIDDGWEDYIGDWNANDKFDDMRKTANEIKKYGLIPGLWTAPFIVDKKSNFLKEHQNWILKDKDNNPCLFSINGSDYYIIDITIKKTWNYFKKLYQKLTNEYGFKYHKLDFTRAPVIAKNANYKNKYITIIEAYRNACLNIRKGMGNSFFLMCGGLYDPLIGIVDAQRSGSDVLSMWDALNEGGKTLPYTMKQNILRYYMNNWWYNDPDVYIVRRNKEKYKNLKLSLGLLNDEEIKTASINQLLGCGLFSISEPLDKIDDDRLNNIYHLLPLKKASIKIKDIMAIPRFPNKIIINEKYLALINFSKKTLYSEISSIDIIDEQNEKYAFSDFYAKKISKGKINVKLLAHSATIIKLLDKDDKNVDNKGHYLN